MKVWIDCTNSPHVLIFRPIIQELRNRGIDTTVTLREFSETIALAAQKSITAYIIGRHGGKNLLGKLASELDRVRKLVHTIRPQEVSLALGHNSVAQAVAARLMRIPFVTMMDYEYQPNNHLTFRLASKVLVPEVFSEEALKHYGAEASRVERYPGIKEDIYLADFQPDPRFPARQGWPTDKIIVTLRPPATTALYHRFANPLFDEVLDYLIAHRDVFIVLLPRTQEQRMAAKSLGIPTQFVVPPDPLDGPNLLYWSDLVISAGGTMNREAAVLGTPAYTIFGGHLGNVDKHLVTIGQIYHIRDAEDLVKIELRKKEAFQTSFGKPGLVSHIVDRILDVVI